MDINVEKGGERLETLNVTMKVVSPLFFMDGDQNRRPEIRAASIKGALRFWYRATCLSSLNNWQEVKQAEMRVFETEFTLLLSR